MNPQLIREQLSGAGPYLIRTSDGKQYPVPHPDFVMVGRHNVVVEKPDGMLDIIDPDSHCLNSARTKATRIDVATALRAVRVYAKQHRNRLLKSMRTAVRNLLLAATPIGHGPQARGYISLTTARQALNVQHSTKCLGWRLGFIRG